MTTTSLFVNRATAKLAVGIVAGDTALTLVAGSGVFFPAPAAGEFFRLVLQKGTGQTDLREYMICTSRAGDVLTVTRGQEGTPPAVFDPGDELSQVITAATATSFAQKVGAQLQGALTVEADPTVALGIATKQFVESGRVNDAPADGKDYARKDTAWHALGAAAGLAVPIPISAGGTGGATLPAAQTNLVIGVTTIDDNPPATPKYGDRWIRPGNMTEMVWVPNAGGGGAGVWINPMDATSEAYPLAVNKGGTGATDAPTALTNLGGTTVGKALFTTASAAAARATLGSTVVGDAVFIAATQAAGRTALGILDYTTTAFKLFDGTVAAPGLAFNSEPGTGWLRGGVGTIQMAAAGAINYNFVKVSDTQTAFGLSPKLAGGTWIDLTNAPYGAANASVFRLQCDQSGTTLSEFLIGNATAKQLFVRFPAGASFDTTSIFFGTGQIQWAGATAGTVNLSASTNFPTVHFGQGYGWIWSRADGNLLWQVPGPPVNNVLTINGGSQTITAIGHIACGDAQYHNFAGTSGSYFSKTTINFGIGADVGGGVTQNTIGASPAGLNEGIDFWHHPGVNAGMRFRVSTATMDLFNDGGLNISGATATKASGTTWANPSSRSIKHDIEDYTAGLDEILRVRPRTYRLNDMPDEVCVGTVADEIEGPFPQSIRYDADGMPLFHADPVIWALVNSIHTLHQRLNQLEHA